MSTQPPRLLFNFSLVATLVLLVLVGGISQRPVKSAGTSGINNLAPTGVNLDNTATVYIAANVATQLKLPVIKEIAQKVDAIDSLSASNSSETGSSIESPAIVNTEGAVAREIINYISVEGDSIKSVAQAYGIEPETLAWANSLNVDDELLPNTELKVPPVDGVLYKVGAEDTVVALAERFGATAAEIIAFNDLDVYPLKAGRQIMIPDGTRPEPVAAPNVQTDITYRTAFSPTYNGNGYDWGWCTWWAAERRRQLGNPIPSNWGNANTWDDLASATGNYRLSSTPRVGAIAQYDRGWAGHVAVVEEVSADGSRVKISDMNGVVGWGAVGRAWVSTSDFETYIY